MSLLKVNGVDIPTPSSLKFGIFDISKAERNAKGNLIIERINTKVKLELSWKWLSPENQAILLTAISGTTFSVTYLDPRSNTTQTKTFYAGDKSTGLYTYVDDQPVWMDVAFNFIEC